MSEHQKDIDFYRESCAYAPGSETSRAAAEEMDRTGGHGSIKRDVYNVIKRHPVAGMTDEEIAARDELWRVCRFSSVVSARNALVKDGLVEDSGQRRKSPTSGMMATVWRVV